MSKILNFTLRQGQTLHLLAHLAGLSPVFRSSLTSSLSPPGLL